MFARSGLSDAGYAGLPNITFLDTIKYWESNILANPRLDAIKFMLPLFGAHFGNSTGERALAVASAHHYPLVWALADGHHDQGDRSALGIAPQSAPGKRAEGSELADHAAIAVTGSRCSVRR